MSPRRVPLLVAMLVLPLAAGGCESAPPHPLIDDPLVLAYEDGRVRLTGQGFGEATAGASVSIGGWTLTATNPEVTWTDTAIEAPVPAGAVSGEVTVRTSTGASTAAPLELYRYEYYPIPATAETNAVPLALTLDDRGALWINEEFHRELKVLEPGADAVRAIAIPHDSGPGPFAVYFEELFGVEDVDVRTRTSVLGESIVTDSLGRVWFSEGGGLLYEATGDGLKVHPNHSRVVSLESGTSFTVYDVPGDRNEVIGLLWDEARQLLWLAEGGRVGGGAITSLDPSAATPEERFRRYALPDRSGYPAHLALDRAGGIWFTEFLGNRLGRLDPASGAVVELPLPPRNSESPPARIFDTGGPWEIEVAPDGSLYFSESFDLSVGRVDVERVLRGDPACARLTGDGVNECVSEIPVADPTRLTSATDLVHSLAFDWDGRLWFGQHGPNVASPPDTLGVVLPGLDAAVKLPPLRTGADPAPVGVTGIAVDVEARVVWFNEYWAKRLSRLTLVT